VKHKFSAVASTVVKLQHGEEVLKIRLEAPPFGFGQALARLFPAPQPPVYYVNGAATPIPKGHADPKLSAQYAAWEAETAEHSSLMTDILIALAMGDAMDTPAPPMAAGTDWRAYGLAVRAEWDAAHLHLGDRMALIHAYNDVQGLGGERGKG
jgi:hypothetical protein